MEEKIIEALFEHGERLERIESEMVKKGDLRPLVDALDRQGVILTKLNQERVGSLGV